MFQKIIIVLFIIISIAAAAVAVIFYLKSSRLRIQVEQSNRISNKFQEDIKRLEEEKKEMMKENEKFQADAVYYTKFTAQLQTELDEIESAVKEKDADIVALEDELQTLKGQISDKTKEQSAKQQTLDKECSELKEKAQKLEETLKKERALYYYNLGVAYVGAKLFNKAVIAYEKALSFDENNAEAHYNLALLYENFNLEPEKAILHYQKYLEIKPDASDKEEVIKWIGRLKEVVYQQIFPEGEYSR